MGIMKRLLDICSRAQARGGIRSDQIFAIDRTRWERGDRIADALATFMARYLPQDYYLYDAQEGRELAELATETESTEPQERFMIYDVEDHALGQMTLREVRLQYGTVNLDHTGVGGWTITVE